MIKLHNLETPIKATFDLFGQKAFIAKSIYPPSIFNKKPEVSEKKYSVYLLKDNGNFGVIYAETTNASNAPIQAIDIIKKAMKKTRFKNEQNFLKNLLTTK